MKRLTTIHVLGCFCIALLPFGLGKSAIAQDAILSIDGECPGELTARITGGEPDRTYFLLFGFREGRTQVPPTRTCAGTVLGVASGVRRLSSAIRTDENGNGTVTGQSGGGACGHFLQSIAFGSCETTNVVQIP